MRSASGLRKFFNEKFGEYGDVQDCVVDTRPTASPRRSSCAGEREPITITINRYEMVNEDRQDLLHRCVR